MIKLMSGPPERYLRLGAVGPRVLLIQGAGAGHQHWGERFLRTLSGRCSILAYNHRGVGRPGFVSTRFTMADLADDAAHLLDDAGWADAAVFGVSFGGVVAQELALRRPGRVRHLMLGGTSPGGAARPGSPAPLSSRFVGMVVPGDRTATSANLFRLGVKDAARGDAGAWREYRAAGELVSVDPRTFLHQMDVFARHSTVSRLGELRVPTLVVHGDADRIIELEDGKVLARSIPGAELRIVAGGHFFWLECPDRVAAIVADFCSIPSG